MDILKTLSQAERRFTLWLKDLISPGERHFLEVRQAILDEVESRVQPMGEGVREFHFNHLVVNLRAGEDDAQRYYYESVFVEGDKLKADIVRRIVQSGAKLPPRIDLEFNFVREAVEGWRSPDFHVEYRRGGVRGARTVARLTVLKGEAERPEYVVGQRHFNIGRTPEPLGKHGRIERRNDMVFLDNDSAVNRSVSRIHAHLWYDEKVGAFRLCDDNSERGTYIFRNGRQTEAPRNNPNGLQLHSGDEIFFGEAYVRCEVATEVGEAKGLEPRPSAENPTAETHREQPPVAEAGADPSTAENTSSAGQSGEAQRPDDKTVRS